MFALFHENLNNFMWATNCGKKLEVLFVLWVHVDRLKLLSCQNSSISKIYKNSPSTRGGGTPSLHQPNLPSVGKIYKIMIPDSSRKVSFNTVDRHSCVCFPKFLAFFVILCFEQLLCLKPDYSRHVNISIMQTKILLLILVAWVLCEKLLSSSNFLQPL